MYCKSSVIIPLFRSCRQIRPQIQSRNLYDLMRPINRFIRDVDQQLENLERNFFRNNALRIMAPRFMPIGGNEPNQSNFYRLNIDVQGFEPEDIKISLKEGVLKIEAQMNKKASDGSKIQQSIVREFTLPPNIEQSTLKSLLHEDGILSIEASLNKPNQAKSIPIEHLQEQTSNTKT